MLRLITNKKYNNKTTIESITTAAFEIRNIFKKRILIDVKRSRILHIDYIEWTGQRYPRYSTDV